MRLKQQIAQRNYRVDSEAVAQEILFKLRVISFGRRTLLTGPGRTDGRRPPAER
jgi:hypothetical protein